MCKSAWHRLMMLEGLSEAGEGWEGVGGRGLKLQSHYWPWIRLWRPKAGLQSASSIKESVRRKEGQEDKGWNVVCVCVCAHACTWLNHYLCIKHTSFMPSLIMADKMVQISRAHYHGNINVNNTRAKYTVAYHWLCLERAQLPSAYCRQRKIRSSWD